MSNLKFCSYCKERIGMIECDVCNQNFCRKCVYKDGEKKFVCIDCKSLELDDLYEVQEFDNETKIYI